MLPAGRKQLHAGRRAVVGSPWQQAWELLYCHTFFLCCLDEIVPAHRNLGAVNWWGHVFCVYMYFEIVGLFVQLFGPPELRSSGNASCFPTAFPYTPSQHKVQRCSSQGMRAPSIFLSPSVWSCAGQQDAQFRSSPSDAPEGRDTSQLLCGHAASSAFSSRVCCLPAC